MSQLKFQPLNLNERILVIHSNGKCLGDLMKLEDGYYQWWPSAVCSQGGCWSAYILREIADKLDELNDAWDQEVKSGLAQALSDHLHGSDDGLASHVSKLMGDAVRNDDGRGDGY